MQLSNWRGEQIHMFDWRGTPIVVGSIIVYPGRQGSSQWMVEAKVLEVFQQDHWGTLIWTLRVQPLRKGTYGRTDMKPVKITALERVTVIPEHVTEQEVIEHIAKAQKKGRIR